MRLKELTQEDAAGKISPVAALFRELERDLALSAASHAMQKEFPTRMVALRSRGEIRAQPLEYASTSLEKWGDSMTWFNGDQITFSHRF